MISTPLAVLLYLLCQILDQSGSLFRIAGNILLVSFSIATISGYLIVIQSSYRLFLIFIKEAEIALMKHITMDWYWGLLAAAVITLSAIRNCLGLLEPENPFRLYNALIVLRLVLNLSFAAALWRVHLVMGIARRRPQKAD